MMPKRKSEARPRPGRKYTRGCNKLGCEDMKIIVGLGNHGDKYEYTKHNTGFLILNAFVSKKVGDGVVWLEESRFRSHVFRLNDILFVKPQTFMNRVGEAVSKILKFYKVELNDLLVVHDDVDLEFGDHKLKKSSGSAGHHGVEDLFSKLGSSDFWRLRVGVGRPLDNKFDIEDYVLEKFSDDELVELKQMFETKIFEELNRFISS